MDFLFAFLSSEERRRVGWASVRFREQILRWCMSRRVRGISFELQGQLEVERARVGFRMPVMNKGLI